MNDWKKLFPMLVTAFITAACGSSSGGAQNQNPPNPIDEILAVANDDSEDAPEEEAVEGNPEAALVPYFDTLLSPEQRAGRSEKYRPLFSNERLLSHIRINRFEDWSTGSDELRRQLLEYIVHFEEVNGQSLPPFQGDCTMDPGPNTCYQTSSFRVAVTLLNQDYAQYIQLTHLAWSLYIEANHIVPWSILDYSDESLDMLFGANITQPVLYGGVFGLNIDSTENYKIVRGALRAGGDSQEDLVRETSTLSVLNLLQFVGERITHIRGTSSNSTGPDYAIWPYTARDAEGNTLLDANGDEIPLDREPTPREILVLSDQHRDLVRHPEDAHGPHYHIVNGCWGASQLMRALLSSINLPVELLGDYASYGGHSGMRFLEVDGEDYIMQHSDNFYYYAWAYGLLKPRSTVTGNEIWTDLLFQPLQDFMTGYSVLHNNEMPRDSEKFVNEHVDADHREEFGAQLPNPFSTYTDLDMRVLAVRALSNPPSIQNLYTRCAEPGMERRHLPTTYLTDQEEASYRPVMDARITADRQSRGQNLSCFELYYQELNELYQSKTGLSLDGDEDGDGFTNNRDCNVYSPDNAPCEGAFRQSLGIRTVG